MKLILVLFTEWNTIVLQLTDFIIIEMRQMKEKEFESLMSQLRDRDKENEALKQALKGNWH